MQQVIRTAFVNATVLSIAHRLSVRRLSSSIVLVERKIETGLFLQSIVDYDKVVVMHEGKVVELDSPLALLERKSRFREMCEQ
jgi:ABC-type multidrug transport system fused ATPase/permease subunit